MYFEVLRSFEFLFKLTLISWASLAFIRSGGCFIWAQIYDVPTVFHVVEEILLAISYRGKSKPPLQVRSNMPTYFVSGKQFSANCLYLRGDGLGPVLTTRDAPELYTLSALLCKKHLGIWRHVQIMFHSYYGESLGVFLITSFLICPGCPGRARFF